MKKPAFKSLKGFKEDYDICAKKDNRFLQYK